METPRPGGRSRRIPSALVGLCALVGALVALQAHPALAAYYLTQAWYQTPDIPSPFTPRWDTASAVFPPSQEVVMFGGAPALNGQGWYNDTWIYSGGVAGIWVRGPAAPAALTPRGGMAMAYDPDIAKVVMFGGAGPNDWPPRSETWLFDGTSWTPGPAAPPALAGRTGAQMAYDDALHEVVLFGGTGTVPDNDTWLFNGTAWVPGSAAPAGLAPRAFFGMTYDPGLARVVLTGGDMGTDTWEYDGTSWTAGPAVTSAMGARERVRLVYDPQLGGDVLFGGETVAGKDAKAFLLKDGAWNEVAMAATPRPGGRLDPQIVWDGSKSAFMLFSGVWDDSRADADTWAVVAPTLTLNPTSGPVGTLVTVTSGPGWVPGSLVHISFADIPLLDYPVPASQMISTIITVPSKGWARWTVRMTDDTELLGVNAYFTIGPRVHLNAPAGSVPGASAVRSRHGAGVVAAPAAAIRLAPPAPPNLPSVAGGQVSARDGRFWIGSQPVLFHGMQVVPIPTVGPPLTLTDYATIASWHFNTVRMVIHWQSFETGAPVKNPDGSWTHTYDADLMKTLRDQISWATTNGLYVLLENSESEEYPPWLMDAPYNSHGQNYTDQNQFDTDYWSDPLAILFTQDWLSWLVGQVKDLPGLIGYETVDEPDPGYLAPTTATTQLLMAQQLAFAQQVRLIDPGRVIFFMTRDALGAGIIHADLSGWVSLGNVALDVHDYWGARADYPWVMDPANPDYGESPGAFVDFTANSTAPPYLGSTITQERFVNAVLDVLGRPGTTGAIPLDMAEFGVSWDNPNVYTFYGTTTSAFNDLGVSWSTQGYNTSMGVVNGSSFQPWLPILEAAAAYGQTGDTRAPSLSSLSMKDTNANGKVDQVVATFNEQLATYTAGNAPWTLKNVPSGGTLRSVSVAGTTATLTLNEGSGAADTSVGSFTVALAATSGGIADASGNLSMFAALAPADQAPPLLLSMAMLDKTLNGKIDRVTATFTEPVGQGSAGMSAWTLKNVPSGGALAQAKTNGALATLTIAEGSGAQNTSTTTSTGTFTVALAANGIVDGAGNTTSFGAMAPADQANPVVVSIASGDGDGIMEKNDTFDVTFSEGMGSIPSSTSISLYSPGEGVSNGYDKLTIPGLTDGYVELGSKSYLLGRNVTATFASSTLSFVAGTGNATVRATVGGGCNGTCGSFGASRGVVKFLPPATLKDPFGNQVVTTKFYTSSSFRLF